MKKYSNFIKLMKKFKSVLSVSWTLEKKCIFPQDLDPLSEHRFSSIKISLNK